MITFEEILKKTPKELALLYQDQNRLFTNDEHEMVGALLAMVEED